ncbi:MAG TPA: hypothetical protein VGR26_07540 [Acidimicrobiales bacterium]|nr:hypothetical protein [Acidimicrobiales bacterium]
MIEHTFRVSRYDPARHKSSQQWTAMSDVGREFDGEVLTMEKYEEVERSYLESIRWFMHDSGADQFLIGDVDWSPLAEDTDRWIRDGLEVDPETAIAVCRLELREHLSFRLDSRNDFYVHFGFDFYMYLGSWKPCRDAIARTVDLGLHVELGVPSPYLVD